MARMNTSDSQLLERFRAIKTWKRGDQRAPHKPLLILMALGRIQQGEDRLVPFQDMEEPLETLLRRYGVTAGKQHPDGLRPDAYAIPPGSREEMALS